jgi:hypothetical protein
MDREGTFSFRERELMTFVKGITVPAYNEAAKVAPDGSHLVRCVVIAYEAHAVTCLATTVALVVDPRGRQSDHQPVSDKYKTGTLTGLSQTLQLLGRKACPQPVRYWRKP